MATYLVTAVDTVVFDDSDNGLQTSSHTASDTLVITDPYNEQELISFWFRIEDTVNFTDVPERLEVVRDVATFSDAAYVISTQSVYVSDGVKLTTDPKTVYQIYVYDTVDFTDESMNVITGYASDTLRVLDTSSAYTIFEVELSDEAVFGDTSDDRIDFTDVIVDGFQLDDFPFPVIGVDVGDTLDIFDYAGWSLKHPVNDTATFTDTASADVVWGLFASDTVEFSEDHKFSIWGNASEIVRILDWTDDVRVRKDALDEVNFTDKSDMFRRYKVQCTDEFVVSDYIDGDISPYIKWLSTSFVATDDADIIAHYKPRIRAEVGFTDDVSARKISRVYPEDTIALSDSADGSVYWSVPQDSDAELILTDTATIKISRHVTTEFTNTLYAGVGSSEVTVYTCPVDADVTHIMNISLANVVTGDITVQVTLYKGGTTPYNIRKDLVIGEGETFVINNIEESGIVIESEDEVRVRSTSPSSLDVFLSVIEKTQ